MKTVPLAEIAKKAHIAPRIARRKLRSARAGALPKPLEGHRWAWSPAKAPKVVTFLRTPASDPAK